MKTPKNGSKVILKRTIYVINFFRLNVVSNKPEKFYLIEVLNS